MQLMNEHHLLKNVPDRYREVDTTIRRKIEEAKRNGPKNNVSRLKDCIVFKTHLTFIK
ncbi:hypothetical protein HHI36_012635, partial [Cryptolaemus montrouzieri]